MQAAQELLELHRADPLAVPKGREVELAANMVAKVGDDAGGDLVGVRLEAKRRIQQDGVRDAELTDQVPVDRGQGATGLA
jgi:hypothetical protein